jgi:hypothetical protein
LRSNGFSSVRSCVGLPLPCFFHVSGYRPFCAQLSTRPQSYHQPVPKLVAKTLSALPLAQQVMGQPSGYPRWVTENIGNRGQLRSLSMLEA